MKITQEEAPFQPVTVTIESRAELVDITTALKRCSRCALDSNYDSSGEEVQLLADKLSAFLK